MAVKGTTFAPTERMNEDDTMEAFREAAYKFIFSAKKLQAKYGDPSWGYYADTIECMRDAGKRLTNMRSMSKFDTMKALDLKTTPYKPS